MASRQDDLPKARLKELEGGAASVYCPRSYPTGGGWRKGAPPIEELCAGCVAQIPPPGLLGGTRILCLCAGWVQDEDGLVHEINYSHERRKRGRDGKYRRTPAYASPTPPGTKALSLQPIRFPARALCPHCDRLTDLDPEVLCVAAPLV